MADPRLTPSRSLIRLLSTTVAGVAALAVIALGVQIGTTGLAFSDDRAAATATARPASALVDLVDEPGGASDLAATLVGLLPPGAMDSASGRGGPQDAPARPQPAPSTPDASAPAEPPAETPAVPAPSDLLPSEPVAPAPAPPVTVPPAPETVTDPVVQVIDDVKEILGL